VSSQHEIKMFRPFRALAFLGLFPQGDTLGYNISAIQASIMKYLIVIEETSTGYSAFSPDLDGCVATGSTKEETEVNIKEAIEFHLEGLRNEGFEIPSSHSYSRYLEIPA